MHTAKKTRENILYTRSLIEASIDPLVTISLNGKITDVNNATIEATGFLRKKLIGSDFSDYFTEPEKARKGYQEVFEKGLVRDYSLAIRHTSGRIMEVLYNARVYKDAQGNVLGVFAAARDITERKKAEKKLEDLSLRYKTILASVPDIIMETDNNKIYTWTNKAGYNFFGEAVIGKEAKYYFESEQKTYDIVDPLFKGSEDTIYVESWQRRKDGEKRLLAWWCRVLKDNCGTVKGSLSTARDITERKKAEKELNQHRQHLKELVEKRTQEISQANKFKESIISTIPSAIVVLNRNFLIIDVNIKFFKVFGCAEKKIKGENLFEVIKCKKRGLLVKLKGFCASKQKEMLFEEFFEFGDTNGSKILRFYVSRIEKEKEKDEQILLVIEDITRAKILETQIIQSERLAATGMLTASVAHEINNPLQGMLTHLELMRVGLPDYSKKLKNYNYVKTNINKISSIVGQLLDIYKGVDNEKSFVAINDIIFQVAQLINNRLSIQGVSLKMELNQQLPKISASRQQLHQVILNLFLNALESMKSKGVITISTFREGNSLKIQVKDTGKGIDKKNLKYIFSPFFSTKRKPGLGLFICQGLIKNHNGDIVVESHEGRGSIFTITLPIQTRSK